VNLYLWVKWVHILSSTVLFGMGAGIAFFFVRAQRTGDVRVIAAVAREVVWADGIFTASAAALQPATGLVMMAIAHYPPSLPWIGYSLLLYMAVGACWLSVVWLQMRMRDLAVIAAESGTNLPEAYFKCYKWWWALGWPAFVGVLVIFWMMVSKWGG